MERDLFAGVQAEPKATVANVLDAVAPFECESCGDVFPLAADEMPLDTGDGAIVCEACYHAEYEFTCCWCEEYEHIDYRHVLLVVFDAEEAGLALPGLYRIDHFPYTVSPMIGMGWIRKMQVTWLGPFTGRAADPDGYPCGHLCRDCQARALADIAAERYALRCAVAALR